MDDLHFGVHQDMMYAVASPPVEGAQWTGIVTQIAIQMLESGQVEAVVCVQSDEHDRFTPKPVGSSHFMHKGLGLLFHAGLRRAQQKPSSMPGFPLQPCRMLCQRLNPICTDNFPQGNCQRLICQACWCLHASRMYTTGTFR